MPSSSTSDRSNTVCVWDLPTRCFHLVLLSAVIALLVTGWLGGGWIDWHGRIGTAVGALLAFRLVWGFVGGHWSRWVQLPLRPQQFITYLRGGLSPGHPALVGHNPLGSLSIVALLFLLGAQVMTGWVIDDEIAYTGPLVTWVATRTSLLAATWHRSWGAWSIQAWVMLHVAAVLWHQWGLRHDLIGPMWHGQRTFSVAVLQSRDDWKTRLLALVAVALCAWAALWVWQQGAPG